ncbi:hypothetical protein KC19_10G026100 [Ceratodon purpureus]|uniref:Uncharacterized protein n=1 Tax=Ceratodon purpureus TaxID=3225 RepID=A0A8T0GIN6_CERPU|nr:hypothetical protein KC19_10G026100 [Ceratodon purpureus]
MSDSDSSVAFQMATKVHDQDDQDFAEIDIILAQAKLELHRDRCRDRKMRRNMNLSDIPENFAHVPASPTSEPPTRYNTRPVSLDTSQPDFASRRDGGVSSTRQQKTNQKLHILGLMAPMKWLRGYMGCLMAAHDGNCDVRRVQQHPSRQRVAGYGL